MKQCSGEKLQIKLSGASSALALHGKAQERNGSTAQDAAGCRAHAPWVSSAFGVGLAVYFCLGLEPVLCLVPADTASTPIGLVRSTSDRFFTGAGA